MGDKWNSSGALIKYGIGDKVKIWKVFRNPTGFVDAVVDSEAFPVKFRVRYRYPDNGIEYVEEFEAGDLTLVEKSGFLYAARCNCGSAALGHPGHSQWCSAHPDKKSSWKAYDNDDY